MIPKNFVGCLIEIRVGRIANLLLARFGLFTLVLQEIQHLLLLRQRELADFPNDLSCTHNKNLPKSLLSGKRELLSAGHRMSSSFQLGRLLDSTFIKIRHWKYQVEVAPVQNTIFQREVPESFHIEISSNRRVN